jgi:hypothetical protein
MRGLKINKQINRPDTPLADSPTPDYRNLPKTKQGFFKELPYEHTSKDSAQYKEGFKKSTEGKKLILPKKFESQGYKEANQRGLNTKK